MRLIPSTTAGFTLKFPVLVSNYSDILISFRQDGVVKIEKHKRDMTCNGKNASFQFTQVESSAFQGGGNIEYQIKVLDTTGGVAATRVEVIPVDAIINPNVMEVL